MAYNDMSPLSSVADADLASCTPEQLIAEIKLFRKALQYCKNQDGDDNCWMDYRHLLMRFLPGYDPEKDDVRLDVDQRKNCDNFIRCWQENKNWACLGGDKGMTVPARSIGTLDCLETVEEPAEEAPWYVGVDSVFSTYRKGDVVVATSDFSEEGVRAGAIDKVESVSSDHHGGLQLNLVGHGRGWSNHVWRKQEPTK